MASNELVKCVQALIARKFTIAFAESASAGLLSYKFSTVPNSGQILLGSLVCYHECLKEGILNIPAALIEEYTAESAEVTRAMAHELKKIVNPDVSVALTGLTSPGGSETPEKPVGTIFIHIILPGEEIAERFEFHGPPKEILSQTVKSLCKIITTKLQQS